jgi:hypothetical protein
MILAAVSARSSTLTLFIEHHIAVVSVAGKQTILRTVFTEEQVIADVKLNVYALPQMPSTGAHLEELQRLSPKTWWQALRWDISNAAGDRVAIQPRLTSTSFRERGPNAVNIADRDSAVACKSYDGTFDLSRLAPGDYTVLVKVDGIESPRFPLAVRTGQEREVRDVYLQEKAHKTRAWAEFKAIEIERVRLDPTKAAALFELAQRSLEFGTLEETTDYVDRAAKMMEQNLKDWARVNPSDAKKQSASVESTVTQLRALQRVLPDYFAHRAQWRITVDGATGQYVITARDTNHVLRRIE